MNENAKHISWWGKLLGILITWTAMNPIICLFFDKFIINGVLFSIHFQVKCPLDRITISETPCTLRRRVCTIVSTDQRARSSFASLFFFSRVYLRDRIRKQPAFSFFYHEFPDLPTFHSVHPRCSTWFDPLDGNPDRIRVICRDILALSWREDNVSICESLLLGFHGTASSFPSRLDFWEDSVKSMRDANNDVEERWKGWVIR